jgi:uncharacterized protein (TIGR02001 family)
VRNPTTVHGQSRDGRGRCPQPALAHILQNLCIPKSRNGALTMNKSILFLALASTFAAAAHAEDPPPFTANISLTTNYKYRGQDQGSAPSKTLRPAVQGGFDWSQYGFYLGNWNSSIGWLSGSSVEMDFYGGYRGEIVKDLSYDVGLLRYQYNGAGFANTTELYGSVGFGPATLKYSHTVSKDYFGYGGGTYTGRNTGYLDLAANFPVVEGLTVNTHVGYTRYAKDLRDNVGVPNYYDYKLGVTYDMSKFAGAGVSISGAVVGANKRGLLMSP